MNARIMSMIVLALAGFVLGMAVGNGAGATTVQLAPTDDSYIDSLDSNGVFGTDTEMHVGDFDHTPPWRICRTYLKFDLSSIPRGMTISSAQLKLYCLAKVTAGGDVPVTACDLQSDGWSESSLNWVNAPKTYGGGPTVYPVINAYNSWDVANHVEDAYMIDDVCSIVMKLITDGVDACWAEFATKEHYTPTWRPYLEITYTEPAEEGLSPWQALNGVWKSDAQWGDINNNGYLDLVVSGEDTSGALVTQVYINLNGTMMLNQDLEGVQNESSGNLGWGDYDGDGLLDLAVAGMGGSGRIARVYKNDGAGVFNWDSEQVLTGVSNASVAWGDYDNDGDLDLFICGHDGSQPTAGLYKNHPRGKLTLDPSQSFTGVQGGSADWVDYDGDGDFDLVVTGHDGTDRRIIFYENDPVGTLTADGSHDLPGVSLSDAAFGDFDNDGDPDLALTGEASPSLRLAMIFANDGLGNFSQYGDTLMSIYRSSCAWGDFDNDGDLDVAFCGYTGSDLVTRVYRNMPTGFVTAFESPGLHWVREGSVSWADVDIDGALDFFLTGADWDTEYATLYRNINWLLNSAPTPPSSLYCEETSAGLRLQWSGADDDETPSAGLYYCIRVGTASGAHDVICGGYGTPLMGNVGQNIEMALAGPAGPFWCAVRAIDAGLMASVWSLEVESYICGDANGDGMINVGDAVFLVNFIFKNGAAPDPVCSGDANGDGQANVGDAVYLINFIFKNGTAPVEQCCP